MSNAGDPLLRRADWLAVVGYWRKKRGPLECARCGLVIDRTPGQRHGGSLDVGHIVSRYDARRMGWTDEQINSLSNSQPECQTCNRAHGARLGNANRRKATSPPRAPITSEPW